MSLNYRKPWKIEFRVSLEILRKRWKLRIWKFRLYVSGVIIFKRIGQGINKGIENEAEESF